MKSRREFLAMLGGGAGALGLASFAAIAQAPGRRRIGFLGPMFSRSNADYMAALRAGLVGLGQVEGQTFSIEFRGQDRGIERLSDLAAALVRSGVDMIVANGAPETAAAKQATSTIPIVMAAANDAVAMRLVANAQRPGGNVTGATYSSPQMMQRRLERLKQAYILARRVAVLVNPANPMTEAILTSLRATARILNVELAPVEVRARQDMGGAFGAMSRDKVNAFLITDDPVLTQNGSPLVELAISKRLPAIGPGEYVEAGGLMSYEVNRTAAWSRAATFAARILRGAKPGDMALEAATRFELVLNKKGARSVGIVFPQGMAARADRIIETSAEGPCVKC